MSLIRLFGALLLMWPLLGFAAAKTVLTIATFPDLDRAAKGAVQRWAQLRPDVELRIVSLSYADHHTAMTTALATAYGLPDVMAIDFRFIGKFGASGAFENLLQPPYSAGPAQAQFVQYAISQGVNRKGELIALPADIGPGTLLYRKDILDKAGLTESDLTQSWESFIAAGKKMKATTGTYALGHAADLRDIVLRIGVKDGDGIYFDVEGRPIVNTDRFVRAFELGRAARQAGIDANVVPWTNEWTAALKQGRVATQLMGAWLAGHLKNWIAPATAGNWRAANMPGGIHASYGGSFYAIPKNAKHKQAAWDFIRFMTLDKQTQLDSLRTLDSFPSLAEAHSADMMQEPIAFLGGQKARLLWRDTAARVPRIAVNKYDALATDVIRDEFENVLTQGKDIRQALNDAQRFLERRTRRPVRG